AVQAVPEGDGLVLDLQADGQIQNVETFVLDSPARLVVDLPGLSHEMAESTVAVEHAQVSGVRVGQHDDKVRVVVDGKDGVTAFDQKTAPHAMGLWVALAGAELPAMAEAMPTLASEETSQSEVIAEMEAAEAAATATETEMAAVEGTEETMAAVEETEETMAAVEETEETMAAVEETEETMAAVEETEETTAQATTGTQVHGVELDSTDAQDRVVIVTDKPADYALTEVDAKTLMVQLRGAHITPEAAVRIAPEQPGVVSMVAAFDQPELAEPEVRVVVERVPGAVPTVSQHGSMLMLDFPSQGETAAPIPVVAAETRGDVPAMMQEQAVASASAKAMKQAQAQPGPAAINPDSFLMAVALGASCAFLTPIGHQNNTLILGPGGYRFGDYWRMGLPLEIIIVIVAVPMLLWVWPL
ncbi:MAG: AMIN domain-containing protein, partial [Pseudomonadota bacterium]